MIDNSDNHDINNNQNYNNNNEINNGPGNIYNPASFQTELLIKYFQDIGILKNQFYTINVIIYQLVKNNQFIDRYVWRCRGNGDN